MANKYVSYNGPKGESDGSSEANAWSLAQAFSNAVAGDYVWVKNDGTYTGTYTVSCNGSWNSNTHIYFVGYNDIANCDLTNHISDMDIAQSFWGGPLNPSLANGWIDIDGGNASVHLVSISSQENLHFRNFYLHNVDTASKYCAEVNSCKGITFTKCKFADAFYGIRNYYTYGMAIYFCRFEDDITNYQLRAYRAYEKMHIYGSVFNTAAGLSAIISGTGLYEHNIFIGGRRALAMGSIGASPMAILFRYNTCYNQADYVVLASNDFSEYNNIFVLNDKSDGIISVGANTTVVYGGYSCAWALSNGGEAMTTSYAGEYGLNQDPLLIDPANDDYTPRNPNVFRNGRPDINGNFTQMGAVFVPQHFSRGSRVFNPGRLSITRN